MFPKDDVNIMDVVPKGSEAKIILQCGGIWFAGGKFGITWKPFQMVVKPKLQLTPGVCHLLDEETSCEKEEKQEQVLEQSLVTQLEQTQVESDEDPEQEYATPIESSAAEPEVPVKGRKKVVKKSTA